MTSYSSKLHTDVVEDNQTKKLKENCIDLIEEKKIKWIDCDLNTWGLIFQKNDGTLFEPYFIYNSDTEYRKGYFNGVSDLSHKDRNHFEEYLNDYFYYGYPNYQDVNSETYEDSECQLAFGSGSNTLIVIHPNQ